MTVVRQGWNIMMGRESGHRPLEGPEVGKDYVPKLLVSFSPLPDFPRSPLWELGSHRAPYSWKAKLMSLLPLVVGMV